MSASLLCCVGALGASSAFAETHEVQPEQNAVVAEAPAEAKEAAVSEAQLEKDFALLREVILEDQAGQLQAALAFMGRYYDQGYDGFADAIASRLPYTLIKRHGISRDEAEESLGRVFDVLMKKEEEQAPMSLVDFQAEVKALEEMPRGFARFQKASALLDQADKVEVDFEKDKVAMFWAMFALSNEYNYYFPQKFKNASVVGSAFSQASADLAKLRNDDWDMDHRSDFEKLAGSAEFFSLLKPHRFRDWAAIISPVGNGLWSVADFLHKNRDFGPNQDRLYETWKAVEDYKQELEAQKAESPEVEASTDSNKAEL